MGAPAGLCHLGVVLLASAGAWASFSLPRLGADDDCPHPCGCEEKDYILHIHCDNRGITSISQLQPPSNILIYKLHLHGNSIKELYLNDFISYGGALSLNLSNNGLLNIQAGALNGLDALRRLYLFGNKLRVFHNGTFSGLDNLEYIQADYNLLRIFEAGTFVGLRKLRVLILNDNLLQVLPRGVFHNVTLRHLDLRGNRLKMLSYLGVLQHLDNIAEVQLEENSWNCTCDLLPMKYWLDSLPYSVLVGHVICETPLRLHGKDLSTLSPAEFCPERTNEDPFPRPYVPRATQFTGLSENFFLGSHDPITPHPNSKGGIPSRSHKLFRNFGFVNYTHVGSNFGRIVDFQTKSPTALSCPTACKCTVHTLDSGLIVDCQRTGIQKVANLQPRPSGMKKLYLSENAIFKVWRHDFQDIPGLEMLHLGNNRIAVIQEGAFINLGNLRHLYLNTNALETLTRGMFVGLKKLQSLYLEYNVIRTIQAGAFSGLGSLQRLFINNNELRELPAGIFVGTSITRLDLHNNYFLHLPVAGVLEYLHLVVQIDLHENPWHCDCDIVVLKQWIEGLHSGVAYSQITCEAPVRFAGKDLRGILYEALCPDQSLEYTPTWSSDRKESTSDDDTLGGLGIMSRKSAVPLSVLILSLLIVLILTVFATAGLFVFILRRRKAARQGQCDPTLNRDLAAIPLDYSFYEAKGDGALLDRGTRHMHEYIPQPIGTMCKNPIYVPREDDHATEYKEMSAEGVNSFRELLDKTIQRQIASMGYGLDSHESCRAKTDAFYAVGGTRDFSTTEGDCAKFQNPGRPTPGTSDFEFGKYVDVPQNEAGIRETVLYGSSPGSGNENRSEYLELRARLQCEPDYLEVLEKQAAYNKLSLGFPSLGLPALGLPALGHASPGIASPGIASHGIASPGIASHGIASHGIASPGIPSPGNASPGIASPGIASHGIASPGIASPGNASPGIASPGIASHGIASPGIASPGITSPGIASPGIASPAIASRGTASPGLASPGIFSPGIASQGIASPGIASPGIASPRIVSPGIASPGIASPGIASPGIASHGIASPGIASPGNASPGIASPGIASHGIASHGIASPGIASPGIASPGIPSPRTPFQMMVKYAISAAVHSRCHVLPLPLPHARHMVGFSVPGHLFAAWMGAPAGLCHLGVVLLASAGAWASFSLPRLGADDDCPHPCGCEEKDYILHIHCDNRGITSISQLQPPSNILIYKLHLHGNSIKELYLNDFISYGGALSLNLSNNGLLNIQAGALNGLDALRRLYLFGNKLRVFHNGTFSGLDNLEYIQADYNLLRIFEAGTFVGLRKLRVLILNDNLLQVLPRGVFHNVTLRHLDLRGNRLKMLSYLGVLQHLDNIAEVQLEENSWNCTCDLLPMKYWLDSLPYSVLVGHVICETPLRLHGKDLSTLSPAEFCPERTNEDPFPRPYVPRATQFTGLSENFFLGSHDPITPHPNSKGGIPSRSHKLFRNFGFVNYTHVGSNFGRIVDFQTKSPTALSCPTACKCTVHTLDSGLIVDCQRTGIQKVANLQPRPSGMKKLYLSENAIFKVWRHDFQDIPGLEMLHLGNNRIAVIQEGAFINLGNLRHLYLNTNALETLTRGMFVGLKKLQSLYLEYNVIRTIQAGAFSGLGSLQRLFINNNELRELPAGIFVGTSITRLDLHNNYFLHLPVAGVLEYLHLVVQIDLHENPWHCDCDIVVLKQWIEGLHSGVAYSQITCEAPVRFAGKDLRGILYEALCPDQSLEHTPTWSSDRKESTSDDDTLGGLGIMSRKSAVPLSVLILSLLIVLILTVFATAGLFVFILRRRKAARQGQCDPTLNRDLAAIPLDYSFYEAKGDGALLDRGTRHMHEYIPQPIGTMCKNPIYVPREDDHATEYKEMSAEGVNSFRELLDKTIQRQIASMGYGLDSHESCRAKTDAFYAVGGTRDFSTTEGDCAKFQNPGRPTPGTSDFEFGKYVDVPQNEAGIRETVLYGSSPGSGNENRSEYLELRARLQCEPDYLEVLEKQAAYNKL
uniref:uncharacterized protein n=1 Tax=Myxine glutinosa TaxID=7769 RepID=UPI00358EDE74